MAGTSAATVHIEESLLRRLDAAAEDLETSRDRLLEKAAEDYLRRRENQALLDQVNRAVEQDEETNAERELRLRLREHHRRLVEGEW